MGGVPLRMLGPDLVRIVPPTGHGPGAVLQTCQQHLLAQTEDYLVAEPVVEKAVPDDQPACGQSTGASPRRRLRHRTVSSRSSPFTILCQGEAGNLLLAMLGPELVRVAEAIQLRVEEFRIEGVGRGVVLGRQGGSDSGHFAGLNHGGDDARHLPAPAAG